MSLVLFRALLKRNTKLIAGYGIGSSLYLLMMAAIFPSIKTALEAKMELYEDMPEGFRAAFGMENGMAIQNVTDVLSMQYYSLIFLLLMTLFTLSLAGKMLAHFMEQGSMAYLLSAPIRRTTVLGTLMAVFLTGLFIVIALNVLFSFAGGWLVGEPIGNGGAFLTLHVMGFLLFAAVGGYCFLLAVLTGDERKTVAYAGGLTLVFYALDLIGKLSDTFASKRYASVFYWFQPNEILDGTASFLNAVLVYAAIGVVCYVLALVLFRRKSMML
ncbi:permease [Paenibacillus sp. HJGM_3]|uniref:permease n=1 Tax=Paenibacillus sp. HJGM_3 TaxID=3379816 RepID=UPI0038592051